MSAALVTACGALACTPQQVFIDKPCPPVEYPVINAPITAAPPADATAPRTLDLRLAPTRDDAGKVVALDVSMRFSVPPVDFGDANPIVLHFAPRGVNAAMADRIDDLTARDSEGSLALRRVLDAESSKPGAIEWRSERRARGPVTISYRLELPAADAGSDEVTTSTGGVFGLGRALLLLPETTEAHKIRIKWDLQGLGTGARGISSFGAEEAETEGLPSTLDGAIWAAGPLDAVSLISTAANAPAGARFRLVTLGTSLFDVLDVGVWANRVWLSARTVGTDAPASQFDLIARPSGKAGQRFDVAVFGRNAIAVVDNEAKLGWPEKLAITRAFVRVARGSFATGSPWFDEGFATYHALEALRRASLAQPSDLAAELGKRAERYFASPWLRTPMVALEKEKDSTATQHAEDRGMLYAAEMDAKIRARTFGKRSLDDVWRAVSPKGPAEGANDTAPAALTTTAFVTALEKEMGPDALTRLSAVVFDAESTARVPDDAFGPCFKQVKKKFSREDGTSKKRVSEDGFTWSLVPKLPPSCASVAPAPQVGGLQKTP